MGTITLQQWSLELGKALTLLSFVCALFRFDGGEHSDNEMGQSTKTAAAGGIVILVANFVYLFLFGAEELNIDESSEVKIQKAW